ncbi:hypothetical protein QFC20_007209 [Naganishia adeliensis]|uniref:Uncharacterized protein n=1 Tax=Naganishia adeliensis TaxID=92952 RepID=A0ACC2V386_9TREE|nr:hypothetical protein QFC20_007209 [Naganishia adeliensis]
MHVRWPCRDITDSTGPVDEDALKIAEKENGPCELKEWLQRRIKKNFESEEMMKKLAHAFGECEMAIQRKRPFQECLGSAGKDFRNALVGKRAKLPYADFLKDKNRARQEFMNSLRLHPGIAGSPPQSPSELSTDADDGHYSQSRDGALTWTATNSPVEMLPSELGSVDRLILTEALNRLQQRQNWSAPYPQTGEVIGDLPDMLSRLALDPDVGPEVENRSTNESSPTETIPEASARSPSAHASLVAQAPGSRSSTRLTGLTRTTESFGPVTRHEDGLLTPSSIPASPTATGMRGSSREPIP